MFQKIASFFSGCNKMQIEGLNIDRLLNGLSGAGIVMQNITRVSHRVITFEVTDKMRKKLFVYLSNSLCYNISIIWEKSFSSSIRNLLKKRTGLLIGTVVATVLLIAYNMFVWDIIITGNEQISDSQVLKILSDNGTKTGTYIRNIDRRELANTLTQNLDEASLVNVEIKGITLIVNIKERQKKPDVDEALTADEIISEYDCQITKITLLKGTSLVKRGSFVKKGDVLAAAYEERYEGSEKVKDYLRAEGEYRGIVWFTSTRFFSTDCVNYVRSGKKKLFFNWEMFGLGGKSVPKSPYSLYESEHGQVKLKFLLPININKTTVYELVPKLETRTPDDIAALYGNQVMDDARQKVPENAEISGKYIKYSEENGMIRIDAVVTTEIIVSTRAPKT